MATNFVEGKIELKVETLDDFMAGDLETVEESSPVQNGGPGDGSEAQDGGAHQGESPAQNPPETETVRGTLHQCHLCGKIFVRAQGLSLHRKWHEEQQNHVAKKYTCRTCGKTFPRRWYLLRHLQTHSAEKPFNCVCGQGFLKKPQLLKHYATDHPELDPGEIKRRPLGINMDEYLASDAPIPDQQKPKEPKEKKPDRKGENLCLICGKMFSRPRNLREHERIHTGEKPYQCQLCDEGFNRKSCLLQHVIRHSGVKPFHCEQCGEGFTRKQHLMAHYKKHTGEKPFHCAQCGKSFRERKHLVTHSRLHTGERPYMCHVCRESFRWQYTLRTHLRTEHDVTWEDVSTEYRGIARGGGRPVSSNQPQQQQQDADSQESPDVTFVCDECGKVFPTHARLLEHVYLHAQPTPRPKPEALESSELARLGSSENAPEDALMSTRPTETGQNATEDSLMTPRQEAVESNELRRLGTSDNTTEDTLMSTRPAGHETLEFTGLKHQTTSENVLAPTGPVFPQAEELTKLRAMDKSAPQETLGSIDPIHHDAPGNSLKSKELREPKQIGHIVAEQSTTREQPRKPESLESNELEHQTVRGNSLNPRTNGELEHLVTPMNTPGEISRRPTTPEALDSNELEHQTSGEQEVLESNELKHQASDTEEEMILECTDDVSAVVEPESDFMAHLNNLEREENEEDELGSSILDSGSESGANQDEDFQYSEEEEEEEQDVAQFPEAKYVVKTENNPAEESVKMGADSMGDKRQMIGAAHVVLGDNAVRVKQEVDDSEGYGVPLQAPVFKLERVYDVTNQYGVTFALPTVQPSNTDKDKEQKELFMCLVCGKTFSTRRSLKTHAQKVHGDAGTQQEAQKNADAEAKKRQCRDCLEWLPSERQLRFHCKQVHGRGAFWCTVCDRNFTNKEVFRDHQNVHTGVTPYQCETCGAAFHQQKDFVMHKMLHTGRPFPCDICGRGFTTRSKLKIHRRIHTGERPFVCELCGKGFITQHHLNRHSVQHPAEDDPNAAQRKSLTTYHCDVCGKQLSSLRTLQYHQRIHTGEKPFQCELCPRAFRSQSILNVHIRTTHEQNEKRKYQCELCDKEFYSSSYLRAHLNQHRGESDHRCDVCGKGFMTSAILKRHKIDVHVKEKAHQCTTCGKAFSQKSACRAHERIHTGERPYECSACGKAFAQKSNLNVHVKKCEHRGM